MAGRLTMVERDALPADERRFHDAVKAIRRRPISGPFITLLNSSPDLAARFAHLGHYFHARGQADESILSVRARTFVALILARALDCPYEWAAWVGWALEAGVPQSTADAVRDFGAPSDLGREDALVLDFCTQLLGSGHRVSDATFARALDHFGAQGVVELAATIGYFAMIAYPLNACEIEMSSEQKGLRKAFEPLRIRDAGAPQPPARESPPPATTDRRARVARITRHEDLAPANQHFFDRIVMTRGRIAPPYQVLLHSADVAARVAHVGEPLLYGGTVPRSARTLAWLTAAREYDCEYELALAAGAAREAGVSHALIEAVAKRRPLPQTSGDERALLDFCGQLLRGNHHVIDDAYRATVERFGVAATVQIAAGIGYFAMWAFILNAFEIEPDRADPELSL
jgi:4-carboxymuconolactone decarboxylase